jgi:polysaccharide pyruvyl transferase WcaK-like protein
MTVFLAGAFGQGNPGDEALLAAFARALPDHRPLAASSDPAATAAEHGIAAVSRDDLPAVGREIARADAVVVAGGTIFKTLHPSCGRAPLSLLRRTAALAAATRALRKPLALVGVGAAPLHGRGARTLARSIVRAADLLVLRDEESAGHLAAVGAPTPVRVGADPAWTLLPEGGQTPLADAARERGQTPLVETTAQSQNTAPSAPERGQTPKGGQTPLSPAVLMRSALGGHAPVPLEAGRNGDGRPVVVALSHLAGGPELADRLAPGLAPVVDAGVNVRLDPWQPDGDADLAAAVATRLGGRVDLAPPPADLLAAREGMAGARLVLAQRFHAIVAAAAAGVPVLAVAHEPKLAGLARRLEQPAVAADAPPATLASAVLGALDGPAAPAAAVHRERVHAEEGFRLLRVLLARGRSDEAVDVDGLPLRPEEWLG